MQQSGNARYLDVSDIDNSTCVLTRCISFWRSSHVDGVQNVVKFQEVWFYKLMHARV